MKSQSHVGHHVPRVGRRVVVAVLVGMLGAVAACGGEGPLRGDGDGVTVSVLRRGSFDEYSFGVNLCITSGEAEVALIGVAPIEAGGEFTFLGAVIASSASGASMPWGSAAGFPPIDASEDAFQDIAGYVVGLACEEVSPSRFENLLVGMAGTGEGGGFIRGLAIDYTADGKEYREEVDILLVVCPVDDTACDPFTEGLVD